MAEAVASGGGLVETLAIEKLVEVCRAHGTRRVSLFGSFARGDAGPESDVDVLVEFENPIGLLAFVRLERELSELLGRPVDLLTEEAISHHLRDEIMESRQVVYEAAG
jgi:predicted nucleotidyltransferase